MTADRELVNMIMEVTLAKDSGVTIFKPLLQYYDDLYTAAYLSYFLSIQLEKRRQSNDPNSLDYRYFKLPRLTIRRELKISNERQSKIHRRLLDEGVIQEAKASFDGYKRYQIDLYKVAGIFASNYDYPTNPTPTRNIFDPKAELDAAMYSPRNNAHTHFSSCGKGPQQNAHTHFSREIRVLREDGKNEEKYEDGLDFEDSSKPVLSLTAHSASRSISEEEKKEPLPKKRTKLPLPQKIDVSERPLPKGASHGFIQPKGVMRQTLNGASDVRQHVSPEVYGLLVYWNDFHGTVTHKLPELVNNCLINPTKTVSKAAKVLGDMLSGTFFLKVPSLSKYNKIFKPEDIRKAMDNHKIACTDLTVLPTSKEVISKTSIVDFLYNDRAVEAGMQYCSPMLYYFLKKPMDSKTYIPDIKLSEREQKCYDALFKHMEKTVGITDEGHWSEYDLKCFRMAARHANKFSLDYDKVFMGESLYTPGGAMVWYIKMAIKTNKDEFSPEVLASRLTPMRIQKYLEEEGHWSEAGFYPGLDYLKDRPELCRMVGRMRAQVVTRRFLVEYRLQNRIPNDPEERKLFNAQFDEYESKRDALIKEFESQKVQTSGGMKRRSEKAA